MAKQQRMVRFIGDVQGVGFRYTACQIARGYDITGYVRNMADGSVECLAEGDSKEIDAFIAELTQQMSYYIRRTTSQIAPYSGAHRAFEVRY